MTADRVWMGHACGVATTAQELEACATVLEQVRIQELRRGVEGSALESHSFAGQQVDSRLLYVRSADANEIIGCLRLTPAAELETVEASRAEYRIDVLPPDHVASYLLLTRFAVLPDHRGSVASLAVLVEMIAQLLDGGFAGALMACEPGLLGLYVALGAKPLGPASRSPSGGFRVPMICIADADELEATGSPLAEYVRRMDGWQRSAPLQRWYDDYVAEFGAIETGVRSFDINTDGAVHAALTGGMSAAGIEVLLKNAQVVQCQIGDRVVAADDGSAFVGIVASGAVQIHREDRTLAVLASGQIFGEMAFVREAPRSADVMALSDDTEVIMLSRNALDRVTDPHDQLVVWQNMARCIGDRLAATNSSI